MIIVLFAITAFIADTACSARAALAADTAYSALQFYYPHDQQENIEDTHKEHLTVVLCLLVIPATFVLKRKRTDDEVTLSDVSTNLQIRQVTHPE